MTTDAPMTANSGPTNMEIINSGTANPKADIKVMMNTPFMALTDPPTIATIRNGQIKFSGNSCKLMYVDS